MRREISEAKPMEAKMHIGLDDVVKRSFERLQKGVTEKAEEKLDAATEKSFAELEKEKKKKNNVFLVAGCFVFFGRGQNGDGQQFYSTGAGDC